jgi:hypothetical protein
LTYYTATKNSFTLLEITIGQEKMHGRWLQIRITLMLIRLQIRIRLIPYGDPDSDFYLMQMRIRHFTLMRMWIQIRIFT